MSRSQTQVVKMGDHGTGNSWRQYAANPATGHCSCGWKAPEGTSDIATATLSHLNGK